MKKIIFLSFAVLILFRSLFAQDDLIKLLSSQDSSSVKVIATFKGQRLVCGQTSEQLSKKHLNFNILHRFGSINTGIENLYGLDYASMRFVLEYGINDMLQVSFGRSNVNKMYDLGVKVNLFNQKKGFTSFPLNISYYGNMGINTSKSKYFDYSGKFGAIYRLNYTNQLILTQKLNNYFSWLFAPTLVHYNLVDLTSQRNTTFLLGLGSSVRISRGTRFNLEYYPKITNRGGILFSGGKSREYLGVSFDIETGGHVFQLLVSNSTYLLEQEFLTQNDLGWNDWGIRLGFNISRTYSFQKKEW